MRHSSKQWRIPEDGFVDDQAIWMAIHVRKVALTYSEAQIVCEKMIRLGFNLNEIKTACCFAPWEIQQVVDSMGWKIITNKMIDRGSWKIAVPKSVGGNKS